MYYGDGWILRCVRNMYAVWGPLSGGIYHSNREETASTSYVGMAHQVGLNDLGPKAVVTCELVCRVVGIFPRGLLRRTYGTVSHVL